MIECAPLLDSAYVWLTEYQLILGNFLNWFAVRPEEANCDVRLGCSES